GERNREIAERIEAQQISVQRGVGVYEIEHRRVEDPQQHADQYDLPVLEENAHDLTGRARMRALFEHLRLRKRPPEPEQDWDDQASDEERNAPTVELHMLHGERR